jgi:hypothetical protein
MSRRDKVAALRGSGFATIDPVEAQQKDLDGVHISGEMNAMKTTTIIGLLLLVSFLLPTPGTYAHELLVQGAAGAASTEESTGVRSSEVSVAWLRRDGGGHRIAVDADGNVYALLDLLDAGGYSDYTTIKYDVRGRLKWVRHFDGPGEFDEASGIAVDSAGNIYVTGAAGADYVPDYVTLKYSTNGKLIWLRRYDGIGKQADGAKAIALDASGNVYVTGFSMGFDGNSDYVTIKYLRDGTRKWVRRYDGPGKETDFSLAIAVDKTGNVYITGASTGAGDNSWDYATIKYAPDGDQEWVKRYDGPDPWSKDSGNLSDSNWVFIHLFYLYSRLVPILI